MTFGGTLFSSLFSIRNEIEVFGGNTIVSRGFASALILNGRVIVIGGDSHTNRVEEYQIGRDQFLLLNTRIIHERSRFGLAKVPAEMFQHLPGGCKP